MSDGEPSGEPNEERLDVVVTVRSDDTEINVFAGALAPQPMILETCHDEKYVRVDGKAIVAAWTEDLTCERDDDRCLLGTEVPTATPGGRDRTGERYHRLISIGQKFIKWQT